MAGTRPRALGLLISLNTCLAAVDVASPGRRRPSRLRQSGLVARLCEPFRTAGIPGIQQSRRVMWSGRLASAAPHPPFRGSRPGRPARDSDGHRRRPLSRLRPCPATRRQARLPAGRARRRLCRTHGGADGDGAAGRGRSLRVPPSYQAALVFNPPPPALPKSRAKGLLAEASPASGARWSRMSGGSVAGQRQDPRRGRLANQGRE